MSNKNIKIDFGSIIRYFKNLKTDMIIAYSILLVGIILVIVSFFI
jgi:hypothetical protein